MSDDDQKIKATDDARVRYLEGYARGLREGWQKALDQLLAEAQYTPPEDGKDDGA